MRWRTAEVLAAEDVLARSIAEADRSMRQAEKLRAQGREPSADDMPTMPLSRLAVTVPSRKSTRTGSRLASTAAR